MKKVIIINGSPRKNGNTAKMLKEAQKGAEETGAEVEYFNLYDYDFKGCRSCFVCKLKGNKTGGLCAIKDEAKPILEKILQADAVIMGSPIYYSYPTGVFRMLLERMLFAAATYLKDEKTMFKRQINRNIPFGLIYTMNVNDEQFKYFDYNTILNRPNEAFINMIFGYCETICSYDTHQFNDYSKYDCDMFDGKHKAEVRYNQFPKDLAKAYDLGKRLVEMDI